VEFDKGSLKTIVFIIILVVSLGQMLLKKLRARKQPEEGMGPSTEAPADEPKLPYEDLAEQVLGPYMERRRKEYEARRRLTHPTESPAEESPPPEPTAPPRRPPAPRPHSLEKREAGKQEPKPAVLSSSEVSPATPAASENSLEARLFGNRVLGSSAKLILASEIMRRPRFLRGAARR
jgi:hypothetical protein